MSEADQIWIVATATLRPDLDNARTHSKRNLDTIAASLKRFGQRKPIVVTADGMIVAGHGTFEAATTRLDWDHIAVVTFPGSPEEAKAFGLADNRSAELAAWDGDLLVANVAELATMGVADMAALGFGEWLRASNEPDTTPQLGGVQYMVLVEAEDEAHQAELLEDFLGNGLRARPIMG